MKALWKDTKISKVVQAKQKPVPKKEKNKKVGPTKGNPIEEILTKARGPMVGIR